VKKHLLRSATFSVEGIKPHWLHCDLSDGESNGNGPNTISPRAFRVKFPDIDNRFPRQHIHKIMGTTSDAMARRYINLLNTND